MTIDDGGRAATWRPPVYIRVLDVGGALWICVLATGTLVRAVKRCNGAGCHAADLPSTPIWQRVLTAVVLVWIAAFLLSAAYTKASLEVERLIVHRLWWRRAVVPLADVAGVDANVYWGVRVSRKNGKPVRIWAVQKSNLAQRRKWDTRADRVSAQIWAAATHVQTQQRQS